MIRPPLPLLERLPYRTRKPDNRPKRVQALTIAVALRCSEGFVLCADTQMSHGTPEEYGSFAHYDRKVFGTQGRNFAAGLCAAGDGVLIKPFATAFLGRLQRREDDEDRERETNPNYEQELADDYARGSRTWAGDNLAALRGELEDTKARIDHAPDLTMIVGVVGGSGHFQLLRAEGLMVCPAGPVEILGIGETSLVRFLTDSLYREDLTMRQAVALGVFVVAAAKKYCPQYCGWDAHAHKLLVNGHRWEAVKSETVGWIEEMFDTEGPTHLRKLLDRAATIR